MFDSDVLSRNCSFVVDGCTDFCFRFCSFSLRFFSFATLTAKRVVAVTS